MEGHRQGKRRRNREVKGKENWDFGKFLNLILPWVLKKFGKERNGGGEREREERACECVCVCVRERENKTWENFMSPCCSFSFRTVTNMNAGLNHVTYI